MSIDATHSDGLGQTGQNLVRIVIASYFIAVAAGMIPGTVAASLTAPFLPEPYAGHVGKAVIFVTAYMVLVGVWLKVAALLLATILFWSSFVENISGPEILPANIGNFWRDLALIGALILTFTRTLPRAERRRGILNWRPNVRRLTSGTQVQPRRVARIPRLPAAQTKRPELDVVSNMENIFREEINEVALAS